MSTGNASPPAISRRASSIESLSLASRAIDIHLPRRQSHNRDKSGAASLYARVLRRSNPFDGVGGVPEWLNGAVSKTVRGLRVPRGFESHPLRCNRPVRASPSCQGTACRRSSTGLGELREHLAHGSLGCPAGAIHRALGLVAVGPA